MIKNGTNNLMVQCFADHPGQPLETKKDDGGKKKKGGGKTVSSYFKGQLDDLMTTLYKTEPHFIRCVVPNTHKEPGGVESGLVMHQYQCNGVLAGIAICRKGFPNKMLYPEFKARYNIIAAKAVAKAKNDKAAAGAVMDVVKLDKEKFRLGHTKVFFRAGILGYMEEVREDKIGSVLAWLQAGARGKSSRMQFKKLQDQKLALYCCQRSIRMLMISKTWKWMQIWMAIKPNLKCTQFGKYKKEYEDKIALAEANIDKAIAECDAVVAVHDRLANEKKGAGEGRQKTEEDIQAMEDKCNHLSKVKGKLEQSLDECEDALEREKKSKGDVEKTEEDIQGDLKLTQEAVADLERVRSELQQTMMRKEKELSSVGAKIEDEHTLGSKYTKQIKELQGRIDELDEELVVERSARAKAEKNRAILSRDIEDLSGRLEEAGSNTGTQIELNKKREAELAKLKGELEEANIQHEGTLAALRSKHNNTMAEMGENIDGLNKMKAKAEKDKAGMERDLMDTRQGLDEAMRERANTERNCKMTP